MFILGFIWFGSFIGLMTIYITMTHEAKKYIQEEKALGNVTKTPKKKKLSQLKTIGLYLVPVFNTFLLLVQLIGFETFAETFWSEVDRQYGIED
jgi:hypothetical protein